MTTDEQKQRFKDIPKWEGLYAIAKDGTIWSYPNKKHNGKFLKPHLSTMGYLRVYLTKNGNKSGQYIHRLIANTFIPNPNNLPYINHKNSIRTDNKIKNLEWCTPAENTHFSKGFKNSSSKYKGVFWKKSKKTWVSVIQFKGINYWIGSFQSEINAAKAYNKKAKELFGNFAWLNKI